MDQITLLNQIATLQKDKTNVLIGIDGRSGSGKSTLAKELQDKLQNTEIVHLDKFDLYENPNNFKQIIEDVIVPFKDSSGQKKILILEGIFALHTYLRQFCDLKIWVEIDREVGFKRGLQRDMDLNGIDNSERWLNFWLPKEDEYIKSQNPKEDANLIV